MSKMQKIFILYLFVFCCITLDAQITTTPAWLQNTPKSTETYYYRVGQGYENTTEGALNKAVANAVYESILALGLAVDVTKLDSLAQKSTLATISAYYALPINVVCKYVIRNPSNNQWTGYVLCQIAKSALIEVDFATFNCETCKEEKR